MYAKRFLVLTILSFTLLSMSGFVGASTLPQNVQENAPLVSTDWRLPHYTVAQTVSGTLNFTIPSQKYAVDIPSPGVYLINFSFTCDYGPSEILYLFISGDGNHYAPAFDQTFNDSKLIDARSWFCSTSYSNDFQTPVTVVRAGSIYLEISSPDLDGIDAFSFSFVVTEQVLSSNAIALDLGENLIQWTTDNTWKWLSFDITTPGLYEINATLTVPWTGSSWAGYLLDIFPLRDYNYSAPYWYFLLPVSIPGGGSGVAKSTYIMYLGLTAQSYFFPIQSFSFLHLGGGYLNLTLDITQIPTVTASAGSPATLRFTMADMFEYVLLDFSYGYEYTVKFESPQGANWTAMAWDAQFNSPAFISYSYSESASGVPYFVESRLTRTAMYQRISPPSDSICGFHNLPSWSFNSDVVGYINDTIPAGHFVMSPFLPRRNQIVALRVSGMPSGSASATFNITLSLQATPIQSLTVNSSAVFTLDNIVGPSLAHFMIPVESGRVYEVTLTPTQYTPTAYITSCLFPDPEYENWYFPSLISPPSYPLLGPGIEFAMNGPITQSFVSTKSGNALFSINTFFGSVGVEQVTVQVTEKMPTSHTVGTLVSTTAKDFQTYQFYVEANHLYLFDIEIDSTTKFVEAVVFDENGNTPFEITEQELWMTIGVPGTKFTGVFLAKQSGLVTLVLKGDNSGGAVHFLITVYLPYALGLLPGSLLGLLIGLLWAIPLGILLGALCIWLSKRRGSGTDTGGGKT